MKVLPDFATWKQFIKQEAALSSTLLDIDPSKVGALRCNAKYCFPCDNSVIRVEKHFVGGRRIGASLVLKDNLIFGVREKPETFKQKATLEEDEVLRNRELWEGRDKRCDFWLEFENGVKLLVEMVDKVAVNMADIPLQEPEKQEKLESPDISIEQQDGDNTGTAAADANNTSIQGLAQQSDSLAVDQPDQPSPTAQAAQQRLFSAQSRHRPHNQDNYEPTKGARLSFTFEDGLVVQILPNGDISQQIIPRFETAADSHAKYPVVHETKTAAQIEKSRLVTRNGQVVRYMQDGNF